jgi:hypothetical protein
MCAAKTLTAVIYGHDRAKFGTLETMLRGQPSERRGAAPERCSLVIGPWQFGHNGSSSRLVVFVLLRPCLIGSLLFRRVWRRAEVSSLSAHAPRQGLS